MCRRRARRWPPAPPASWARTCRAPSRRASPGTQLQRSGVAGQRLCSGNRHRCWSEMPPIHCGLEGKWRSCRHVDIRQGIEGFALWMPRGLHSSNAPFGPMCTGLHPAPPQPDDSQRWHASPSKPAKQRQRPVARSQMPALLHSAFACAVVGPVGMSTHAASAGHVLKLQAEGSAAESTEAQGSGIARCQYSDSGGCSNHHAPAIWRFVRADVRVRAPSLETQAAAVHGVTRSVPIAVAHGAARAAPGRNHKDAHANKQARAQSSAPKLHGCVVLQARGR
jgi:hypothetical protein